MREEASRDIVGGSVLKDWEERALKGEKCKMQIENSSEREGGLFLPTD